MDLKNVIADLGLNEVDLTDGDLSVHSPINGLEFARVHQDSPETVEQKITAAKTTFEVWRMIPPPKRGELIRLLGEELRTHKEALGELVTIECGKILQEGLGEVQEVIDICDFSVGLSRQLYGLTIASERPGHRMMETWHPLGVVGVISAFNFPVAVWAWNAALAITCGNPVIWKPSEKTPLTALACQKLFQNAVAKFGEAPPDLAQIIIGGPAIGEALVENSNVSLISATGSTRMGQIVGPKLAARFGRSLLELGGNNALVLTPSADLALAEKAILFSSVGTAGQRCTSLRRLIVHKDIKEEILERLIHAYGSITIGNPLDEKILVGPLIDGEAGIHMEDILAKAAEQGGKVHGGGRVYVDGYPDACYMQPAIVDMPTQSEIVKEETFAPILYVLEYEDFEEALKLHNDVPQGLASSIFTTDLREAEKFLSAAGSDCGIANVNIGPSGAEIGGAFGGEKQTGGGRESGSDAWKNYMRRATNTINYSDDIPLAQGIKFGPAD